MKILRMVLGLSVIGLAACKSSTAPLPPRSDFDLGFNGSDFAQVGATPATLDLGQYTAWTAEAWVKPEAGGDRRQFILAQWGDPGHASWALELEAGYLIGETHDGNVSLRMTDSVALSLNVWHHVAFSYAQRTGTVYVDGKAIASSTQFPVPMVGVQPLLLGASGATVFGDYQYPLTGELAEVRLWSGARTAQQIASGRSARLRGTEAGLLAYWPLDEGTGDARDRVHGLIASLGGIAHMPAAVPAWVADPPPVH